MTIAGSLIGLAIYAAIAAVLLFGYWVYGVIDDRLHARRMVRAFDEFVAGIESQAESRRVLEKNRARSSDV